MAFKSPLRLVPTIRARMDGVLGALPLTYAQKVLGLGPIAYWPLWELSGTTAQCLVNPAQNGTYARDVTVMGTGDGIGDRNTAPVFDGINDVITNWTATLAAAFNGLEGTSSIWFKVFNVGVWTDGASRLAFRIGPDTNNSVYSFKRDPSILDQYYVANAVSYLTRRQPISTTAWVNLITTWSDSGDEAIHYWNGGTPGIHTPINTWIGAAANAWTAIGGNNPASPSWHGQLAHMAFWSTPLTAPQIADLATV